MSDGGSTIDDPGGPARRGDGGDRRRAAGSRGGSRGSPRPAPGPRAGRPRDPRGPRSRAPRTRMRPRRSRPRRSACALMANGGADVPLCTLALARRATEADANEEDALLSSRDAIVRSHAARGLARSEDPTRSGRLANAYAYEPDPLVRRAILAALAELPLNGSSAPSLAETIALAPRLDPDPGVRSVRHSTSRPRAPSARVDGRRRARARDRHRLDPLGPIRAAVPLPSPARPARSFAQTGSPSRSLSTSTATRSSPASLPGAPASCLRLASTRRTPPRHEPRPFAPAVRADDRDLRGGRQTAERDRADARARRSAARGVAPALRGGGEALPPLPGAPERRAEEGRTAPRVSTRKGAHGPSHFKARRARSRVRQTTTTTRSRSDRGGVSSASRLPSCRTTSPKATRAARRIVTGDQRPIAPR